MLNLGIRHAAIPVTNLQRALNFYCDVLGFRPWHVRDKDWAMVTAWGTGLSLVLSRLTKDEKKPRRLSGSHPAHIGVCVSSKLDVDACFQNMLESNLNDVNVFEPKLHRDGSYGFYFEDTESNLLELIWIPHLDSKIHNFSHKFAVVAPQYLKSFLQENSQDLWNLLGKANFDLIYSDELDAPIASDYDYLFCLFEESHDLASRIKTQITDNMKLRFFTADQKRVMTEAVGSLVSDWFVELD